MSADETQHTHPKTLFSVHHWKARLLLWTAASLVGVAAVAFAKLADLAHLGLRWLVGEWAWWPWLTAPVGFFGIAWLTRRFFRGAEGSGIPQTIFALRPDSGEAGLLLLKPHVVIGRVVLAGGALLCGASIGREGPTVHVGAVIVHSVARWMPHGMVSAQRRALILAGGAAGVAAAFNTPLAGVVFAIEELSKSFEERASGTTLTAVILAGIVAIALVGDYTYFGQPSVTASAQAITWTTFGDAISCGLAGGLFSRITLASVSRMPAAIARFRTTRPALFAAICGLLVAAIGSLSGGLTYGTGYEEARSILENHAHLSWAYAPERAAATLLSYLSGIPAGCLPVHAVARYRPVDRRPLRPDNRRVLRNPRHVWLPGGCQAGAPDFFCLSHGIDRTARNGPAFDAQRGSGDRHIQTPVAAVISDARDALRTVLSVERVTHTHTIRDAAFIRRSQAFPSTTRTL